MLMLRAERVIVLEFCENKNLQRTKGTPEKSKVYNWNIMVHRHDTEGEGRLRSEV